MRSLGELYQMAMETEQPDNELAQELFSHCEASCVEDSVSADVWGDFS